MKTQIAHQSETPAKTRRRLSKKQRGVAIITVLAVIVLMSALVLSFFQMSQSEQVASKTNAEVLRSFSLRDTAINLAIGQIREATAPTEAQINGNALWTSQPGLIRTFQKDGNNGLNYKLYSAMNMVVDGNAEEETMLGEDQSTNWKQEPAVWVDLNQPVYRPKANQNGAALQGNVSQTGTAIYPIIDPSAYNPTRAVSSNNANADLNPEGFRYEASNKVGGVSPDAQTLPMPVRWLYILEDGTIGFLNVSGLFTSTAGGATPTANNPIVGRIAFWADDESCKINVNTASEGVFWDTPRCDTPEERFLANCQPTANEFQRFPGHPAGVCLSSVLFPNKRYYASGPVNANGTDIYQPPGVAPDTQLVDKDYPAMKPEELQFLWDLAPMVSYRAASSGGSTSALGAPAGSVGGIAEPSKKMINRVNMGDPTKLVDTTSRANPDDHLYTSTEELLFRGKKAGLSDEPEGTRITWATVSGGEVQPLDEEVLLQRVNRAKFLLTTKSSAPEVNVWGHPRISLWPLYHKVPSITSTATGAPLDGANYTGFDSVISLTAQLNSTNYYSVVRKNYTSRHDEFYGADTVQNVRLRDYLRLATGANIGGVTTGKLPGVPGKNTFLKKYEANTGDTKWSDMANLIVNMLDYVRMTNLADPALAANTRYGNARVAGVDEYPGQITAFCGCGGTADHAAKWAVAAEPDPKGVGRTFAPTRIHWVIMRVGKANDAGNDFTPASWKVARNGTTYAATANCVGAPASAPYVPKAVVYEMGIVVEGAAPAQGVSSIIPSMSVGIGGGNPAAGKPGVGDPTPGLCIGYNTPNATGKLFLANRTLTKRSNAISNYDAITPLTGYEWNPNIPNYGGSQGIRAFSNGKPAANNAVILFQPFAVEAEGAEDAKMLKFESDLTRTADFDLWNQQMWRLMVFDGASGVVNDLVQAYYFNFGRPYKQVQFGLPPNASNKTLNEWMAEIYKGEIVGGKTPWQRAIDSKSFSIHTMVMPHGDYRTTTARRVLGNTPGNKYSIVENGVGNPVEKGSLLGDKDTIKDGSKVYGVANPIHAWNSFVPTPRFGVPPSAENDGLSAYMIYDPIHGMLDASKGINTVDKRRREHLAYTSATDMRSLLTLNAVMDYPYHYKDYVHFFQMAQRQRRGSMDPAITGDWQTGIANTPDGSYIDKADEGDLRPFFPRSGSPTNLIPQVPYFGSSLPDIIGKNQGAPNPNFGNNKSGAVAASPSRQVKGPVQFGSLASGSSTNALWQTLMFRPDPFGGNPNFTTPLSGTSNVWDNRHYGSTLNPENPKDHLLLDFFWMPVVEPYALSDTFSTRGKLNMNYKIFPFDYIHRSTHLHALFKAEKILAIPTAAADVYKIETPTTTTNDPTDPARMDTSSSPQKPDSKRYWRKHIHAVKTLWQFDRKFAKQGEFANDKSRVFRTASEICDLWLIPESLGVTSSPGLANKTENPYQIMRKFWIGIDVANDLAGTAGGNTADQKRQAITDNPNGHRLTGDNVKESAYANLYSRLTTKSNVFKVHFTVQTLQKARSTDVDRFIPNVDLVTSEHRGSAVVERTLDMTNPNLQAIKYLTDTSVFTNAKKRLDYYYSYRITELKQFSQ